MSDSNTQLVVVVTLDASLVTRAPDQWAVRFTIVNLSTATPLIVFSIRPAESPVSAWESMSRNPTGVYWIDGHRIETTPDSYSFTLNFGRRGACCVTLPRGTFVGTQLARQIMDAVHLGLPFAAEADAPVTEAPVAEAPVAEAPVAETPVAEAPATVMRSA
jgi:hypothetical protein